MQTQSQGRSRYIVPVFATAVALCFIGISAVTSYRFGHLLGTTDASREIWGVAGVVISAFKAVLPFALAATWICRRWVAFAVTTLALIICCAYTISASYNVASADRAITVAGAEDAALIRRRMDALGSPRPESVLRPLIDTERDRSARAALVSELARSKELAKLEALPVQRAGTAETGVRSFADATGLSPGTVRNALLILLAACLELGEVAGLYLAAIMYPAPAPRQRESATAPVAAPVIEEVAAEAPPSERAATPRARPAARATSAIDRWLEQYLTSAPSTVETASAWKHYTDWQKNNGGKKLNRLAFSSALRDALTGMGAEMRSTDGLISYRRAA
jgi:DNA-binding transcriptional ArsR family regulator